MIKFEVGKVYKRLDLSCSVCTVCARTDKNVVIKTDYSGDGQNFDGNEFMHEITVIDGVEVLKFNVEGNNLIARADEEFYPESKEDEKEPEANIEEVKLEDKEEDIESDDWVIGKEYEAILLKTKQRFKAVFVKDDEDDRHNYPLRFQLPFKDRKSDIFNDYGNAAEGCFGSDEIIIFKHGIKSILDWKESREPVCFEDGKIYKGLNEELFTCKTTFITANNEKVGIFYNEDKDAVLAQKIHNQNNVEYTCFMNTDQLDFIADEKYRDEIQGLL